MVLERSHVRNVGEAMPFEPKCFFNENYSSVNVAGIATK